MITTQTKNTDGELERLNLAVSLKFFNEFLGKGDLRAADEVLDECRRSPA